MIADRYRTLTLKMSLYLLITRLVCYKPLIECLFIAYTVNTNLIDLKCYQYPSAQITLSFSIKLDIELNSSFLIFYC